MYRTGERCCYWMRAFEAKSISGAALVSVSL
jgi:hypothetical protein